MGLRFLNSYEIDIDKWDACIERFGNGLPYGYGWVLNCLHVSWGGIVLNDYEAVLPLPFTIKYGMRFGMQSPWIQQLGVFADKNLPFELVEQMWALASEYLQLINYKCHAKSPKVLNGFTCTEWQNLILPLNKEYETLKSAYNQNTKRNIKKAARVKVIKQNNINLLIDTYRENQLYKVDGLKAKHLMQMENLIKASLAKNMGFIKVAYNDKDDFLGGCFYFKTNKRLIHLLPALTDMGREHGAMFSIIDGVIKEFCEKDLDLDLEGSMVESIARFYKGFGAKKESYFEYYKENMNPLMQLAWRFYRIVKP